MAAFFGYPPVEIYTSPARRSHHDATHVNNSKRYHLPEDLLDEVLDYVRYVRDVGTLKQCALVCRSWVHPSQSHLFRYITMRLYPVLKYSPSYLLYAALQLSPHLAHYVRAIDLDFLGAPPGLPTKVHQELLIAAVLPQFSNLIHISVSVPSHDRIQSLELWNALRATISSPHIEHVSLAGEYQFANLAHFSSLITPRSLTSLHLVINTLDVSPASTMSHQVGPPIVIKLLSIHISKPGVLGGLIEWFKMSTSSVVVRKLILAAPEEDNPAFMNFVSSHLEGLVLAGTGLSDLGSFTKLASLSLGCHPNLMAVLRTLPADNHLELLKIKVSFFSEHDFASTANELDEYLASERFPLLRAVTLLVYYGARLVESSPEPLKRLMPLLIGRRKLKLCRGPGDTLLSDTLERLDMGIVFVSPIEDFFLPSLWLPLYE